eukprot:CAMPEP_0113687952 /NCGR_PEP_ID=MMETSP0038_2-20120614/16241_1 /TAXON_ID=2898 /ORGANISM="Cryptomonas paramecium" /LENGTH=152 /DNA_ID=CAMNT_0000608663 /DNA_START=119 /DNA_END=574 /DNA_ORIENTATION=+ /assembly_acc=CAM_ASM_000170
MPRDERACVLLRAVRGFIKTRGAACRVTNVRVSMSRTLLNLRAVRGFIKTMHIIRRQWQRRGCIMMVQCRDPLGIECLDVWPFRSFVRRLDFDVIIDVPEYDVASADLTDGGGAVHPLVAICFLVPQCKDIPEEVRRLVTLVAIAWTGGRPA